MVFRASYPQLRKPLDVILSHDWPDVTSYGDVEKLCAGHPHWKYAASSCTRLICQSGLILNVAEFAGRRLKRASSVAICTRNSSSPSSPPTGYRATCTVDSMPRCRTLATSLRTSLLSTRCSLVGLSSTYVPWPSMSSFPPARCVLIRPNWPLCCTGGIFPRGHWSSRLDVRP
jgi:hypothetical protein